MRPLHNGELLRWSHLFAPLAAMINPISAETPTNLFEAPSGTIGTAAGVMERQTCRL
jgi:hypothetical protein